MLAARRASRSSLAFGAVLVVLGVFAVLAPLFTGIGVTVLVGLLLGTAGVVQTIFAFQEETFGKGALRFLFGGLGIVAGVAVLMTPERSLGVLTILLAAYFVASGIVDVVFALKAKPEEGWGWMLFSGIMALALGVLIMIGWPATGLWAVGLYVGVRILTHGWVLMALGRTGQEALTHLQDTRVEALERHVRDGALALLETQAALAGHSAMIVALDAELRKKVSTSEVDPAIQALNADLKVARERMAEVDAATTEAWAKVQDEANDAFQKLRQSSAQLTERLKKELGVEPDKA
jgi:uncharacterized membrane protein HdeD (DUF308 family)